MEVKTETLKVVIVDDELGMCTGAKLVLDRFSAKIDDLNTEVNYEIEFFNDGGKFLEVLPDTKYDIVLLDYKLGDYDGFEILGEILKQHEETLTIMITAYATLETAVQATKLGAFDFLAKPFTPEELRYSVRKASTHFLLTKRAKQLEEEKRKIRFQFISVLSHELKSPINAIEGYINILQSKWDKLQQEDLERTLDRCKIRLDGMRKLIFDLLDLTRIESGEKKRVFEEVNLYDIAKNSIDLLEIEAEKKNIKINFESENPINIHADKSEMDIVFNNLISNSIKYNKDNGSVDIKISCVNDKIKLVVADTGIGLKPEEVKKLFKDFVRIKNDKTIHILGSGLGLSTVKKIARLYNGDAYVESKPDEGSTFYVEFLNEEK